MNAEIFVELFGGPEDGRSVRVYDITEEIHIPITRKTCARYLRNDEGRFQYQGMVENGTK